MLTVSDPTPEEREKAFRRYRSTAVIFAIGGLVFIAIAIVRARTTGFHDAFDSLTPVLGPLYLVMAVVSWRRALAARRGPGYVAE